MKNQPDFASESQSRFSRPPRYHSYLLRFWEERSDQPEQAVWRFSLEDPLTDQRYGFPSLETLIAWLQTEMAEAPDLAVNVFHYYDTILALIFPSLATVFNIFLLRQAFKTVPNDLIDAARIDGAGELRIWWSILVPIVRPSLATAAIITFVNQWNDFFWPSLMLHTRENMTLQVGLVALQGMFASDSRGMAAGVVMTVVPIIIFFIVLQRQFVRGLAGAVKG